jgi:NAD(P)-dependent dehydrogenase (short-subunit alcohol dehydrogenase family)
MDYLNYRNKRVVICGCVSGMGEATAKILLELGAEVHGLDYAEPGFKLASFNQLDLRDQASIDRAAAKIDGKVDAFFLCAGLPHTSPPLEVMKVNFIGTKYVTERMIPLMAAGGAIAIISSRAGREWHARLPVLKELIAIDDYAAAITWCEQHPDEVREGYVLSKEAVVVWVMMRSSELIKKGIRINCTMPGSTETPMMSHFQVTTDASILKSALAPSNRRSVPAEQAAPIVFLNSDVASYINGAVIPVDGGFMAGVATGMIDGTKTSAVSAKK